MQKLLIITPSSVQFVPYLDKYIKFFSENEVDYINLIWDRFDLHGENGFVYKDGKNGHARNIFDYFRFIKYVIKVIKKEKIERVFIFGIQISFFLYFYLRLVKKISYFVDIRDWHFLGSFFPLSKFLKKSEAVFVSSPGFSEWLGVDDFYVDHNYQASRDIFNFQDCQFNNQKNTFNISYIGSLRDTDANINLINELKNTNFNLIFHGDGISNEEIKKFINKENVKNATCYGRYARSCENEIYLNSDLVNVVRFPEGVNNLTSLPNRLYAAVYFGKPLVAYSGTYLSKIVEKYDLGVVLEEREGNSNLMNFIKNFSLDKYNLGRKKFAQDIKLDNEKFISGLNKFL